MVKSSGLVVWLRRIFFSRKEIVLVGEAVGGEVRSVVQLSSLVRIHQGEEAIMSRKDIL